MPTRDWEEEVKDLLPNAALRKICQKSAKEMKENTERIVTDTVESVLHLCGYKRRPDKDIDEAEVEPEADTTAEKLLKAEKARQKLETMYIVSETKYRAVEEKMGELVEHVQPRSTRCWPPTPSCRWKIRRVGKEVAEMCKSGLFRTNRVESALGELSVKMSEVAEILGTVNDEKRELSVKVVEAKN